MAHAIETFVLEAELRLESATDPAAPGAAVTTALCGHWEHEGPCRWPHNNELSATEPVAMFRTLFAAPTADEVEGWQRIEDALQGGDGWVVLSVRRRPVSASEQPLAARLATLPSR